MADEAKREPADSAMGWRVGVGSEGVGMRYLTM